MSKKDIKSRVLIGDRLIGTLLYTTDKNGKGYLKFSLKNKLANFVKSAEVLVDVPIKYLTTLKLTEHTSIEISYKFQDSLLELKRIVSGKLDREFHKIPLPVKSFLFILRIKDYHFYDKYSKNRDVLVLPPPRNGNKSVAVLFSFIGEQGVPFKHPKYNFGLCGVIDLPEKNLNKLCIGITEDKYESNQSVEFIIPMYSI